MGTIIFVGARNNCVGKVAADQFSIKTGKLFDEFVINKYRKSVLFYNQNNIYFPCDSCFPKMISAH